MALKTFGAYFGLLLISLFSFAQEGEGLSSLHYRVELPAANSRNILIQVEAIDFPSDPLTGKLPFSCLGKRPALQVNDFVLKPVNSEPVPIVLNDGTFQIDVPVSGSFSFSFQLIPRTNAGQWDYSFCEPRQCLLFARDFVISLADKIPSQVEFKFPAGWDLFSQTVAGKKSGFELFPDTDQFFFITSHSMEKILWPRMNLHCVYIETSNEQTALLLAELKKQSLCLQEAERVRKNRNLLLLFEGSSPSRTFGIFSPIQGVMIIQLAEKEKADYSRQLARRRNLALELSRIFYPGIESERDTFPDSVNLFHYLSWKILLKSGEIDREDFLELVAEGIRLSLARKNVKPAIQTASETEAVDPIQSVRVEGISRYFLMDLWLECFGRQNRNLADLLSKIKAEGGDEQGKSVPWLEQFRKEKRAAHYAEILFGDAPVPLKDILRPFGLIFFQRNIPAFEFQLSESCMVEKITGIEPSGIRLGDRILAIERDPLYSPLEILKLRSIYIPGQTVNLTVERNGIILKIPYRLAPSFYSRLELNRLADSDKLERVDKFLAKAKAEP